jgi:hypothetical protein
MSEAQIDPLLIPSEVSEAEWREAIAANDDPKVSELATKIIYTEFVPVGKGFTRDCVHWLERGRDDSKPSVLDAATTSNSNIGKSPSRSACLHPLVAGLTLIPQLHCAFGAGHRCPGPS